MNFSYPSELHFFISTNFKNTISAVIVEIHIYKDSRGRMLSLKKDKFVGIFDSMEKLNNHMEIDGFINLTNFSEYKEHDYISFTKNLMRRTESLKEVIFERVDSKFGIPCIRDENYAREKDLQEKLEITKKAYSEFIFNPSTRSLKLPEDKYIKIDLASWTLKEKQLLFLSSLQGIYYYYTSHTDKKDFDIKTYKAVQRAMLGENSVEIYEESIKWFNDKTKMKLKRANYKFPDRDRMARYSYEPREKFNDSYYNDQLDMDQQDPEFWDSL